MSEQKRYYWIKLKTDFFNQETIDFLLSQENGCQYIVLYQMLCLNTANSNGEMATRIGEMIVPYDVNKIVRDTKYFTFDTVAVALELFKKLGLIYQEEGQVLRITNFDNMVGSETRSAQIKRKQRQNNIPLKNCKRLNAEMLRLPNGNTVFVDEKRYGGNGMLAYDLTAGKCEMCGSEENLCIHHNNEYSNEVKDLYILCRKCHSYVENNKGVEIVHSYVHQEYRDKSIENRDKNIELDNKDIIPEEEKIPYQEIVNFLNESAGTNYRASSRKTKDLIKARMNEGYTLEDFKIVIEKKTREWINDTKMRNYLRPETLFGTKFEGYLNQKVNIKEKENDDEFVEEGYYDWINEATDYDWLNTEQVN